MSLNGLKKISKKSSSISITEISRNLRFHFTEWAFKVSLTNLNFGGEAFWVPSSSFEVIWILSVSIDVKEVSNFLPFLYRFFVLSGQPNSFAVCFHVGFGFLDFVPFILTINQGYIDWELNKDQDFLFQVFVRK